MCATPSNYNNRISILIKYVKVLCIEDIISYILYVNLEESVHLPVPQSTPLLHTRRAVPGKGKVNATSKEQSHPCLKLIYWRL